MLQQRSSRLKGRKLIPDEPRWLDLQTGLIINPRNRTYDSAEFLGHHQREGRLQRSRSLEVKRQCSGEKITRRRHRSHSEQRRIPKRDLRIKDRTKSLPVSLSKRSRRVSHGRPKQSSKSCDKLNLLTFSNIDRVSPDRNKERGNTATLQLPYTAENRVTKKRPQKHHIRKQNRYGQIAPPIPPPPKIRGRSRLTPQSLKRFNRVVHDSMMRCPQNQHQSNSLRNDVMIHHISDKKSLQREFKILNWIDSQADHAPPPYCSTHLTPPAVPPRPAHRKAPAIPVPYSAFDAVRQDCLKRGTLYEDPEFLADDTSIYYTRYPQYKIEWKRPTDIADQCASHAEFVVESNRASDIKQGQLGDCWLLAALSCITSLDHQDLLRRLVPEGQSFQPAWYCGMFRFNFWHFGDWTEIVIDDRLPTVQDRLICMHSERPNEFWPALLEKAYAKLHGSYEALKCNELTDCLTDLTGGVTECHTLDMSGDKLTHNLDLVSLLYKALERDSIICCGIQPVSSKQPNTCKLRNGLMAGQTYCITDLREILLMSGQEQLPITLIRVRNLCHTRVEWNGRWSDGSKEWLSIPLDDRQLMGLMTRDDSEFWMDVRDFRDHFHVIHLCHLIPDIPSENVHQWRECSVHGRWYKGWNAGGRPLYTDSHWANPEYALLLDEYAGGEEADQERRMCSVVVQLLQVDNRRMRHRAEIRQPIGFVLYKCDRNESFPLCKDFFHTNPYLASCDAFVNSRQVTKRLLLPQGTYVLVPCTYEPDQEALFIARALFEEPNNSLRTVKWTCRYIEIPYHPVINDTTQMEQFRSSFYNISREDMELNSHQLCDLLNSALAIGGSSTSHVEIHTCKCLVSAVDNDKAGRIGYSEFLTLWRHIQLWKKVFYEHDVTERGCLNSYDLRNAISSCGYTLSPVSYRQLVFRYSDQNGNLFFTDFVTCMAKLLTLFTIFSSDQRDDRLAFTCQQWLENALST